MIPSVPRQHFVRRWTLHAYLARHALNDYIAIIDCIMASITIRELDEATKEKLRVRAAHHRRSMEEEARSILRAALSEDEAPVRNLAEAVRRRFQPFGGVELALPKREPIREPPERDP
jgi:plasmid stability protein